MVLHFAAGWDEQTREPVDVLAEDRARSALESGEPVVVAEADDAGAVPDYVVVLRDRGEVITSQRYDEHGRLVLVVHHHTIGPGLFRTGLVSYTYPDAPEYLPASAAASVRVLRYGPDGVVSERTSTRGAAQDVIRNFDDVAVDHHWVLLFEWGAWERYGLVAPDDLADPRA